MTVNLRNKIDLILAKIEDEQHFLEVTNEPLSNMNVMQIQELFNYTNLYWDKSHLLAELQRCAINIFNNRSDLRQLLLICLNSSLKEIKRNVNSHRNMPLQTCLNIYADLCLNFLKHPEHNSYNEFYHLQETWQDIKEDADRLHTLDTSKFFQFKQEFWAYDLSIRQKSMLSRINEYGTMRPL
jgi:hypothetical protein